jgi:hypothetical protein
MIGLRQELSDKRSSLGSAGSGLKRPGISAALDDQYFQASRPWLRMAAFYCHTSDCK